MSQQTSQFCWPPAETLSKLASITFGAAHPASAATARRKPAPASAAQPPWSNGNRKSIWRKSWRNRCPATVLEQQLWAQSQLAVATHWNHNAAATKQQKQGQPHTNETALLQSKAWQWHQADIYSICIHRFACLLAQALQGATTLQRCRLRHRHSDSIRSQISIYG